MRELNSFNAILNYNLNKFFVKFKRFQKICSKLQYEIVEIRKISAIHGVVHRALTENVYFKRERVPSIHRSNNVNVEVD